MFLFKSGPCAYILLLFPESDISLATQSDTDSQNLIFLSLLSLTEGLQPYGDNRL